MRVKLWVVGDGGDGGEAVGGGGWGDEGEAVSGGVKLWVVG